MTKAKELRKALGEVATYQVGVDIQRNALYSEIPPEEIAAAICDTLGIEFRDVAMMRAMASEFDGESNVAKNSYAGAMWAKRAKRCRAAADRYATLLEVAGR